MFERLASVASFLRRIVAHLECPDTLATPQQVPMQTGLPDQLGMERSGEQIALLEKDRTSLVLGQNAHILADALDPRRPDEHASDGVLDALDVEVRLERVHLAT